MSTTATLSNSTEFQFEDLFSSSPVIGSWNTPDNAALNARRESFGTTEEDIGGEQDYSDEEEEQEEEKGVKFMVPLSPESNPPQPVESIKLSSTIGPHSFFHPGYGRKGWFWIGESSYFKGNE